MRRVGGSAATTVLDGTTVTLHLKLLQHAGLVEVRKQGRQRLVRPCAAEALDQLRLLVAALDSDLAAAEACRASGAPGATRTVTSRAPNPHA